MNKGTRKRFIVVFAGACLFYGTVGFNVTEKMTMRRASPAAQGTRDMSLGGSRPAAVPSNEVGLEKPVPPEAGREVMLAPKLVVSPDAGSPLPVKKGPLPLSPSSVEPGFLVTVPLIVQALEAGWVDREGLIFTRKDAYNKGSWKKPVDIIRDRDENGIRTILGTIGHNHVVEFLRREGLEARDGLTVQDLALGKGYGLEKKRLAALYDRYVPAKYASLFPLTLGATSVVRAQDGYDVIKATGMVPTTVGEEKEWVMPNLSGLPIRVAIERLSHYTTNIRVYGSGTVAEQAPKAFERLRGDADCLIQGRIGIE